MNSVERIGLNAIRYPLYAFFLLWAIHHPLSASCAEEISAYAKAVAAYQDRQLEQAFSYAKEAVRQEPNHVDAYVLLGELYYLRQELPRAKESWERALKLAPSRQDVQQHLEKLKKEAQVEHSLSHSDTYPFVVRFPQGEVPVDLGVLRQLLRDTYRNVGQQFQYFPDHTITVLLYPEADFEQVKGISHQVAGLYDGKIRLPLKSQTGTTQELKRILWHEYTHALIHDLTKGQCPLWLNEGIATVQEARVRAPDLTKVKSAFSKGGRRLVAWDSLWRETQYEQASLELRYQQAFLIAQYLVKRWGWEKMANLLKDLGQGYPITDALRTEYRENPSTIEQEWLTWASRNLL